MLHTVWHAPQASSARQPIPVSPQTAAAATFVPLECRMTCQLSMCAQSATSALELRQCRSRARRGTGKTRRARQAARAVRPGSTAPGRCRDQSPMARCCAQQGTHAASERRYQRRVRQAASPGLGDWRCARRVRRGSRARSLGRWSRQTVRRGSTARPTTRRRSRARSVHTARL